VRLEQVGADVETAPLHVFPDVPEEDGSRVGPKRLLLGPGAAGQGQKLLLGAERRLAEHRQRQLDFHGLRVLLQVPQGNSPFVHRVSQGLAVARKGDPGRDHARTAQHHAGPGLEVPHRDNDNRNVLLERKGPSSEVLAVRAEDHSSDHSGARRLGRRRGRLVGTKLLRLLQQLQRLPAAAHLAGNADGAGLVEQAAGEVVVGLLPGLALLVPGRPLLLQRRLDLRIPVQQPPNEHPGEGPDQADGRRRHRGKPRVAAAPPADAAGEPDPARRDGLAGQPVLQVLGQGLRGAVAAAGVLLQALEADRLEVAVHRGVQGPRPFRLALDDLQERVERRLGLERRPAGEQLVEDGPQAVDVGGRGQPFFAAGLLRRHVARRAQDGPAARPPGIAGRALGQAEVGDVRLAARVEQDVGRFEVAVEDAALVRVMHRPRHRRNKLRGVAQVRSRLGRSAQHREAAALDELHGEVVLALVLADLVDGHDVGVIQLGGGLRLGAEALHVLRGRQVAGQDHFQGDGAAEAGLAGPEDDAHAAAGQFLEDLISRNPGQLIPGFILSGRAARRQRRRLGMVRRVRLDQRGF
jgi:hypothetical protein